MCLDVASFLRLTPQCIAVFYTVSSGKIDTKSNGVGLDSPLSPPHVDISKPIVNENTQYHGSRVYKIF